jgi:hypothetical protein
LNENIHAHPLAAVLPALQVFPLENTVEGFKMICGRNDPIQVASKKGGHHFKSVVGPALPQTICHPVFVKIIDVLEGLTNGFELVRRIRVFLCTSRRSRASVMLWVWMRESSRHLR